MDNQLTVREVDALANFYGSPVGNSARKTFSRLGMPTAWRSSRSRSVARTILSVTLLAHAASADPMPAPAMLPTPEPHIRFTGGNGSSCRRAVVIAGAHHETEGVRAERWWVFTKQAGSRIVSQDLSQKDGRQFETIRILTADGSSKTVCFDITSFFGVP
jgi:hypothetical protein